MKPAPARGRKPSGPADYVALFIATGAGAGYSPLAPGTFGALVGMALYLGVLALRLPTGLHYGVMMTGSVAFSYVGIWAGTRAAQITGLKDPGLVVVDEVAGQFITCAFLPPGPGFLLPTFGFVLFRLFDIVKPYPIRQLEFNEGGLGIMADDVLAGLLAGVVVFLGNLALVGAGY